MPRDLPVGNGKLLVNVDNRYTLRTSISRMSVKKITPLTGKPFSVSPLTWSHATFVDSVNAYLDRRATLLLANGTAPRLRRWRWAVVPGVHVRSAGCATCRYEPITAVITRAKFWR
jgi:hypothetical protein